MCKSLIANLHIFICRCYFLSHWEISNIMLCPCIFYLPDHHLGAISISSCYSSLFPSGCVTASSETALVWYFPPQMGVDASQLHLLHLLSNISAISAVPAGLQAPSPRAIPILEYWHFFRHASVSSTYPCLSVGHSSWFPLGVGGWGVNFYCTNWDKNCLLANSFAFAAAPISQMYVFGTDLYKR